MTDVLNPKPGRRGALKTGASTVARQLAGAWRGDTYEHAHFVHLPRSGR